jgi:hypothetical protein
MNALSDSDDFWISMKIHAFNILENIMRNARKTFFALFAITLFMSIGQSHAGIIVSNINATVNGTAGIFSPATPPPEWQAQEFTTGSQSVTLGTVIVSLGDASGTFTPFAELVTDDNNKPGSMVLTSFTVPSIGTSFADLTFSPTSSVLLSANTSYWFVLGATGSGPYVYQWQWTNTADPSLSHFAHTENNGASWTSFEGSPFLIQVNSVPEPSSFVLTCLGCPIVVGAFMSRRLRPREAK